MRVLRTLVLCLALAGTIMLWHYRGPLRSRIIERATLSNDSPSPELVQEMIEKSPNPQAALLSAWNSGKIVHRQVAIRELWRTFPPSSALPPKLESLLLGAALDPDTDVREAAFGILQQRDHPALAALAAAQLRDPDPQVRLIGLEHLRGLNAAVGVPLVMPFLDDLDPTIVAMGLKLLESWTDQKFGVKLADAVPIEDEKTGLQEFREGSVAKAKAGAERAKLWWAEHQSEFNPVHLEVPASVFASLRPVPAGDFELPTLDRRKVRLSDFRGKVVLLNFWTTWCPACVSEMPELIALQKRLGDRLAILGVSLDFVPDEHGHIGGHEATETHGAGDESHPSLQKIREKVARTKKARNLNYTVLLDEDNSVGGQFNGGELPTTVIVDAQGQVRRRFIGARGLPVFEAMIAEASQPIHAVRAEINPQRR